MSNEDKQTLESAPKVAPKIARPADPFLSLMPYKKENSNELSS